MPHEHSDRWRAVLSTKPFVRAPVLLFKSPAVLAAIIGAAAILGLVAGSTPLYLSSAESAALERELSGRCSASYDLQVSTFLPALAQRQAMTDHLGPRLGQPVLVAEGSIGTATYNDKSLPLKLMYRTGFADDLDVIDRVPGEGLWMGERLAGDLGVAPGSTVTVWSGPLQAEIPVVAVVGDLYDQRSEPDWCQFENILEPTSMGDLPTPLVFVDLQAMSFPQYEAAFATYGPIGINEQWTIPVDIDGLTTGEARAIVDSIAVLEDAYHDEQVTFRSEHGPDEFHPSFAIAEVAVHSDLGTVVERIEALGAALGTAIDPLAAAVLATALGLMGMAGSYWVDRRRAELRSLAARGVSPGQLGVKAGLEAALPILAGSVLGWAAAGPVVRMAGPGGRIDPTAFTAAASRAGSAAVLGAGIVIVVAAVRSRSLLRTGPSRARAGFGPLLPIAFGAAAWWIRSQIGDNAVVREDRALVGSIDPMVVLYPMLAFAAIALAGGYALSRLTRRARRARGRPALYLASRRLSSAPLLATVLVIGAAIPVATLVYSATLTRSTTSTIDAKGRSFIGADVSAPVYSLDSVPSSLAGQATVVALIERGDIAGQRIDVLAIDPDTFQGGAFWDESFSDTDLGELLDRLGPLDGGAAPALVANGDVGDGLADARGVEIPIHVVGRAEAFPGARRDRPLIVISTEALGQLTTERSPNILRYLLWASGGTVEDVTGALAEESIGYAFAIPATRTLDLLKFQSVVWTFDFLELYAMLAGLIAVGAILLYSDTRQRSRNLAYALARRMGLSRSDHKFASLLETAIPLLIGVLVGAATALFTARSVYLALDPVPETPPGPRWVPAQTLIVVCVMATLVLSWVTAVISQRAADGADTSELLRHEN